MKPITLLLADDHAIVRQGLRQLLETGGDIQVVGEAENGRQAVLETKRLQPDVVLLDLAMPLLNGIEAARQIAEEVPSARVLVLSSYSDPHHLRQAVEAGAAGYFMKESAGADLLAAIRATDRGAVFYSPPTLKHLLEQSEKQRTPAGRAPLSRRQAEILQLIAEGHSTKQIADLLSLCIKTVEKHRQTLMDKLDIHEIATLTRYALANGVIESTRIPGWPAISPPVLRKQETIAPPRMESLIS